MSFDSLKAEVIDKGLCEGCGLCAGACKAISMKDGVPTLTGRCVLKSGANECGLCFELCPQAHPETIPANATERVLYATSVRTKDAVLAEKASNGGFVTTAFKYLLEKKKVKAIVAVQGEKYSPEGTIVTDVEGLLETQGTRYSPSSVMTNLFDAIRKYRSVAVVGLPCELRGVSRLEQRMDKKVIKIGLFCTNNQRVGPDGKKVKMGSCEHCTDFIGTHADISVGFAGSSKAYTSVVTLTESGKQLLDEMLKAGLFETTEVALDKIEAAQKRKAKREPAQIVPSLRERVLEILRETGPMEVITLSEKLSEPSDKVLYHVLVLQDMGEVIPIEDKQNPYSIAWQANE